jgi:methyl-accepting chemotaxis protein
MYTEADVNTTRNPVEIQNWLIQHASSRTPDFDRIGFYSAVVGVNKLNEFISNIKIGKTGFAYLYNSEGEIIASSAPLDDENYSREISKSMVPVIQSLQKKETGSEWIKVGKFGDKFVTYQPVENADWGFVFMIDESQVYSTANEIGITLMISGFIMGLSL